MGDVADQLTAKFRYNAALAIAGIVALCGALPFAASRWYLAFVLLVPLAVVVWGWRAGVDVRHGRLTVRWAIGHRSVTTDRIRGFTVTRRGVSTVLTDGRAVWLPAVPSVRVPALAEAAGLQFATGASTATADPDAGTAVTGSPADETAGSDGTPDEPVADGSVEAGSAHDGDPAPRSGGPAPH